MISTLKTPEGPFMRVQMDVGIGEKVYGWESASPPL